MIISTRAALGTEALATLAAVEVSLESIKCQPVVNFSFDFHQFLLLFIDIFKALESVTTLFQSKHIQLYVLLRGNER